MKAEVRDHQELAGVDQVADSVPQDFSVTFRSAGQRAFVDMELKYVEGAEMADDQQKVESSFHTPAA